MTFTLPQNWMDTGMATDDLIAALKRKDDVGPLLLSLDKKILHQRQVLIALQCHYTLENLNAFEQNGFELKDVAPSSIWTAGVDPEFFKKYLLVVRDHMDTKRSDGIAHSFIATLCFQIFSEHTHTHNLFEQYLTLFEHALEVFGDTHLYSLRSTNIYYDYGEHWEDKHWNFYNTYCSKNSEWDTDLSAAYEYPLVDKKLQENLLDFVAHDKKLSALWDTLERESLERQKIFEEFLPQLDGGRAVGGGLPFLRTHLQENDPNVVDLKLLWDFDANTVVNSNIDRVLGFDLQQVYQYTGLRFHHFSRFNSFVPKLVFPSFQHKQLAALETFATTLDPGTLFNLLQHPLTRRNCLEGARVSDVRHLLKHAAWIDWRDEVGNTFGHLLLGFSHHKKQSWVRLMGAQYPQWMETKNIAGFTPRDVLMQDCGEGDLELYDKILLRKAIKRVRRNTRSKRKI